MNKIKVFTTDASPYNNQAGEKLTKMFEDWQHSLKCEGFNVDVHDTNSNSNKYGWMLTVIYSLNKIGA